ncbi:MAG: Nramp family divalent metal transporter [Bacillota bacterium]|nr:Nramp family divalent metal transporter [Bacillota bacterium]
MQSENISLSGQATFPAHSAAPSYSRNTYKHKSISFIKFLGPAFVVSVAYIDPGNFATNISGGSRLGYTMLWVVLWSNLISIFLQIMSAKLGIATNCSLPQLCSQTFRKQTNWAFWIAAEIGAMATDLAEFLGGALGFYLLFHVPMWSACIMTGALTFLICQLETYSQKLVEAVITILVAVIGGAYLIEIFLAKPDWMQVGVHTVIPQLPNGDAVIIAVGMLGATVMPHVIYLHSQLVQCRCCDQSDDGKRYHLKMEKIDIFFAMNIAFFVNAAMVIVSAAVFFGNHKTVDTIQQAQLSLTPMLGALSGGAFGIALLASGLSSSAVGTMAGQTIMKGFVGISIPVQLRRLITMIPAMLIILSGINAMEALIWSQVALSFILPIPIIQMLCIAKKREIMGNFTNSKKTQGLGWIIAFVVIMMNIMLLCQTFFGIF